MIEYWGNIGEGVFWIFVALVILFKTRSMEKVQKANALFAAAAFVAFGISDFIESTTGAWWRPVSLLILKAACILIFAICLVRHKKLAANLKNNIPSIATAILAVLFSALALTAGGACRYCRGERFADAPPTTCSPPFLFDRGVAEIVRIRAELISDRRVFLKETRMN